MAYFSPIQILTLTSFLWEVKCAEFEWNDKELISLVVLSFVLQNLSSDFDSL